MSGGHAGLRGLPGLPGSVRVLGLCGLLVALVVLPGAGHPPPPPEAAPAVRGVSSPRTVTPAQFRQVLTSYDLTEETVEPTPARRRALAAILAAFPRAEQRDAVRVAWCESRLDPTAVGHNRNGSSDHGLFQFNDGGTLQHYLGSTAAALDPERAARAAYRYVREAGWRPWACASVVGAE